MAELVTCQQRRYSTSHIYDLSSSTVKAEANITYDYLEQGSFAAYNKTTAPMDITVTLAKDGTPGELQQAVAVLERLRTTTELISFVTPLKEHQKT